MEVLFFGEMCRGCPDVNTDLKPLMLQFWDNIDLWCRLKRLFSTAGGTSDKRWCPNAH